MHDSHAEVDHHVDHFSYNDHLIAKIAHLHYVVGHRQRDIAARTGLSTSTVSRYLATARERGYVQFRVHDPYGQINDLEVSLEKRFNLKECLVAPYSESRMMLVQNLSALASHYLLRTMQPGELLGLGWGETLRAIGMNLNVDRPLRIGVIPLIGSMGEVASGVYPNAIAAAFARKLGARHYLVNIPAILGTARARKIVESDESFQRIRELWSQVSTAFMAASDISESCSLVRRGIISRDTMEELRSMGVRYTMNGTDFDAEGSVVRDPVSDRFISLKLPDLHKLRDLVLVAYGPSKVATIHALLSGGHVNALLTDEKTATEVLKLPPLKP